MYKSNNSRELTKDAMANFLDSQDWNLWTTLSTEYALTMNSARRSMQRMSDRVFTQIGGHRVFWAAEPFDVKEGYHLHSLWAFNQEQWKSDNKAMYMHFVDSWRTISRTDRANVYSERYDKSRGAHHYCAKYISKNLSDYDIFDTTSKVKEWHTSNPEVIKRIRKQVIAKEDLRIYAALNNITIQDLKDEFYKEQRSQRNDEREIKKELSDMFTRI